MEFVKSYFSRRKFTLLGVGALSSFAVFRLWPSSGKKGGTGKSKTVKMLAQDGNLVEVDVAVLSAQRRKVSNTELQNWIKK